MENRCFMRHKRTKYLALGGALIGALFVGPAYAYDQMNTHPALTTEIVNFYNLNFPQKLSDSDKKLLIQGAVDEDQGLRPMNHFYDPVHNRGMAGFPTSKQWAMSSAAQSNFSPSKNIAESVGVLPSSDDFSYERALSDYARGDRQRALVSFGHVLHLLEDANVPDHTRNDAHPPVHNFGSPYEHEMAKWNPGNFHVADKFYREGLKPVRLAIVGSYFDGVAKYSNGNFFSEDTIFSDIFSEPRIDYWKYLESDGELTAVGFKKDPMGDYEVVKKLSKSQSRNFIEKRIYTVNDPKILDGYWDRLSKDIVLNGAGALNLFITEAEKAKKDDASKSHEKPWFAKLFGLIGINPAKDVPVDNSNTVINNGDTKVTPNFEVTKQSVSPTPLVTKIPDTIVTMPTPTLSPSLAPIANELATTLKTPTPTPAKTPITISNGGGGGSTASPTHSSSPTPTPTPSPAVSPSSTPMTSPTPTSILTPTLTTTPTLSPTPSPTPSLTPTPTPSSPSPATPTVVINEIAWMGTASSSNDEWLELYNTTANSVDMSGWTLKAKDGTPDIALSGTMVPFGFYLLERTNDHVISNITADKIYVGALGNGGENLELRDGSGNLQDSAPFQSAWPAGDNNTKSSMERINPRQPGDSVANWATNSGIIKNGLDGGGHAINGTPKSKNSVYVSLKPSAVTNLAAAGLDGNFGKFSLTWSTPDDLDTLHTNLTYDLRYATRSFILADTWDTASKLSSISLPSVVGAGAPSSASFSMISYGQKWYFALKTKNKSDPTDISDISNISENTTRSAISDAWGMLGGNNYHTSLSKEAGVKPDGAKVATKSWEFNAGAEFAVSQPVVSESGNVYFGASDGSSGKLISLDKNGVKQWEYSTNVSIGMPAILSDDTIYFGRNGAGGSLAVTALNKDGSKRWDFDDSSRVKQITVSEKGEPHFTYQNGAQDKLSVLRPDGSVKTQIRGIGIANFSPIVLENGVIIVPSYVSGNQFFTAYSADGIQLWQQFYTGANGNVQSNLSHDRITGKTYSTAGSKLFDISLDGLAFNDHQIAPQGDATTMVAISGDALYAGFDYSSINPASGSKLFALNKSDLTKKWLFSADSRINHQIAVDKDENVYFSTEKGKLYGLTKTGELMWVIDSATNTDISPILARDALIWGYGNKLTKVGIAVK